MFVFVWDLVRFHLLSILVHFRFSDLVHSRSHWIPVGFHLSDFIRTHSLATLIDSRIAFALPRARLWDLCHSHMRSILVRF